MPLQAPTVGCVVVFEREGGGHVGLVVGADTKGRLLVLGGNQGDAVSIAPFDRSRVDMMRAYAETDDCRRAFLLSYFGEPFEPPRSHCDNCEAGRVAAPPSDVPFPVGARVAHGQWGEGVVQRYDDDAVVVLFDEAGYKTLALEVIRERAILTSV